MVMLRRLTVILLLVIATLPAVSQIFDPVTWSFRYEKTAADTYEIVINATIEKDWHIYSMDVPDGPIPTTFRFDTASSYTLEGDPFEATPPEEKFDSAFGFNIKSFSNAAEFRQKIVSSSPSFTVSGELTFSSCNDETCTPPKDVPFEVIIGEPIPVKSASDPIDAQGKGLLSFFFASLLLGLLGVITPCVYPMIPMTVGFFSRNTQTKGKSVFNALIFGLSIVLIYSSPGIIISLTGAGAGFANTLSTHWIPNILFFLLFVIFASSFLGAFELVLPAKWTSGADSRVDKGGLLASFFLALTTVLVSFSCTGPIIGSLLVEAASGDVMRPTVGMFAFGLGFALPFTLFALFPAYMSKLPKSGGWLNAIKVVLAILMLAFSMKFLMTVDSVYGFNLLNRDIYIAIWIVLFSILGFYLLGKIKFAHDSDIQHIGIGRLFLVVTIFTFVLYLFTGLLGAPLKGLSSMLPSQQTSWAWKETASPVNETGIISQMPLVFPGTLTLNSPCSEPKYADKLKMPSGLTGYFDYKQGLECAKAQGKPVLIDFKGHACANCKLMEAKVWSDPKIMKRLQENFVIIALYVDDRTELPESEWFTSKLDGRVKKTIGKQNEDLEISKFNTNAMPLYVITDSDGNPLNKPMTTNLNIEEYAKWLDEGVANFKNAR